MKAVERCSFEVLAVAGALVVLLALPARAGPSASATLVLDGFSFFFFEGAQQGSPIPSGVAIPLRIAPMATDAWSLAIAPGALTLPPVVYPSGRAVQWALPSAATGTLRRSPAGIQAELDVDAVAYVEGGSPNGIPFSFHFTTERAEAQAGAFSASRTGARIDPKSGYVQLVAAGIHPSDAATAPGKPFYVVLSGAIQGLDAAIAPTP
jgi:hypothetical protein